MKIKAICIDDKNRPKEIPAEKWVKEGTIYNIKHVYYMVNQGIQGCDLWEFNIKDCKPYDCFRLSRFGIDIRDVGKLMELIKACNDLDDVSDSEILESIEELQLQEEFV